MNELFSVAGKVVIVTGALGHLGRQFATAFAEGGGRVIALDREIPGGSAVKAFPKHHAAMLFIEADVTNRAALEKALEAIQARFGVPEILVNNAGLDSPPGAPAEETGPFENYPEASWDQVLDVNLKGVFLCCQVFGGAMAKAGRGSVINISSIYGVISPDQRVYEYRRAEGAPFFKPVAYAASKSGLLNLTRYLATYWAERGVRVNTLTFGGVFNHQDPRFLKNYCAKVPLGRMANPDEYNGAVLFLASQASSYMTGANMVLDGGFTAW